MFTLTCAGRGNLYAAIYQMKLSIDPSGLHYDIRVAMFDDACIYYICISDVLPSYHRCSSPVHIDHTAICMLLMTKRSGQLGQLVYICTLDWPCLMMLVYITIVCPMWHCNYIF